jgi:hypothetical protein
MANKRPIRTQYNAGAKLVRVSASASLDGAVQAATMRLLHDGSVNIARIYSHDSGEVWVTLERQRRSVTIVWDARCLYPRPRPAEPEPWPRFRFAA